jgi:CHAD domain-containing protein
VAEFPVFDEENLHEFRKKIKKIRYVAEIHSANSVCGRIAEQMKRAQAAIGEWHDWQVLAQTAGRGKHAKDADAVELLSSLAGEAFETALATCHGVLQRMSVLGQHLDAGVGGMRRGPVASQGPMAATARKLA